MPTAMERETQPLVINGKYQLYTPSLYKYDHLLVEKNSKYLSKMTPS